MSSEKDYSVLPEVTIIQESAKIESEEHKPKKLRVCAYARVSTEKEEQEYSFENQRDYYMDYISKRSDWEFVGIYSDFGLSGKNKKRPQFIKMIDDCVTSLLMGVIVLDMVVTPTWAMFAAVLLKLLTVILNGFFGYKFGFENIVIDTVNYMSDQIDLMEQMLQYVEAHPVPALLVPEAQKNNDVSPCPITE